jgi:ElaB/YqjD/DUF883 family membrane-anchored ribosome-binding protein
MAVPNKAAADATRPATQWLEDHGDAARGGADRLLEASSRYIAAHPLQSVGLAIAAGYLLSRLTR